MKKQLFFSVLFGVASLSMQAQEATIKLTGDQYNQIKEGIIQQQEKQKTQSYDWANFGKYAEANAKLKEKPNVIFMGNSITELWAKSHPDFFSKNHFLGRGISGQTSSEMLVRFRSDVIKLHPNIVIINAGTNDIACNNGVISNENVLGNIISMAELAKINHIRPILSSILPTNLFPWRRQIAPANIVVALNKMIKEYAHKNHITYIDYYSAMVDSEKGLPKKYSKDGVHPTIEGYEVMEKLVIKTLK